MARDPFSYLLELRRRHVRDHYWFAAGLTVTGLGLLIGSRLHDWIGVFPLLVGVSLGYLGYRRGLQLAGRPRRPGSSDGPAR